MFILIAHKWSLMSQFNCQGFITPKIYYPLNKQRLFMLAIRVQFCLF